MTTGQENTSDSSGESLERLSENLGKVEALSQRLIDVMSNKKGHNKALNGPDQELFTKAATAYWNEAMENP
ncbi:MAG: polyhydroxyalkanoate synthase, partial [Paracoccaceae bacterium]